jgi:hypothetical protein
MTRRPDPRNDPPTSDGPLSGADDEVVGEARWPMAGAVLATIILTILLPDDVRAGPKWVFPLAEGVLLVVVIARDPGKINRRSSVLRALSIALVSVLVIGALWETVLLTDDLIHGGGVTDSVSDLLAAGSIVWARTILRSLFSTGSSTAAAQQRAPTTFRRTPTSRSPST